MVMILDRRAAASPLVEEVWRAHSERAGAFVSTAASHWELVVTRREGAPTTLVIRGPETRATPLTYAAGGEWFGIRFRLGTCMPLLPAGSIVNDAVTLPAAGDHSFWLQGAAWPFPEFAHADAFIGRLERAGLLVRDPVVAAVLQGRQPELSMRSIQRRFMRTTGLTHGTVRQIERARLAMVLLQRGVSILDVVHEAGFYDQPHLTRALKRWIGQTPAQITGPPMGVALSL